jgi:23S rRNA-/tRNA-specific pseudouridylate synthase
LPSETHAFTALDDDKGERVDRFLAARISSLSRSRVKALIEEGRLTRDGAAVPDPSQPVRSGATYRLEEPPSRSAAPQAERIPLDILFEDRHLIVLDKAAGLVVHPAPGHAGGTLVNAILGHAGDEMEGIGGEARPRHRPSPGQGHLGHHGGRKEPAGPPCCTQAFHDRDLDRVYLALVWGGAAAARGRKVEGAIGRHGVDRKRKGGGDTRRQARAHALRDVEAIHGACPCSAAAWRPGGSPPDPRPLAPLAFRCWANPSIAPHSGAGAGFCSDARRGRRPRLPVPGPPCGLVSFRTP